jgi:hypothetical protein
MLESSVEIIAIARTKKRVTGIKNNKTQYLWSKINQKTFRQQFSEWWTIDNITIFYNQIRQIRVYLICFIPTKWLMIVQAGPWRDENRTFCKFSSNNLRKFVFHEDIPMNLCRFGPMTTNCNTDIDDSILKKAVSFRRRTNTKTFL